LGEVGIPVYVVDKNHCIAKHSKYCKKFFKSPDFIRDEFAWFLKDLAEKEAIKDWLLIPSNDHAVYTISKHKRELEKYYKVITPDLEVIDRIYDKLKLLDIAKKNDIPVPLTQNFHSVDEPIFGEMDFPVLTKGRNGLSFYRAIGKKAFLAYNEKELRDQLLHIQKQYDISKTFTQELIPYNGQNKTISFTAFCDKGEVKTHWTGIKLREHPIKFGTATFTKSTYIEACHRYSEKLLKALGYTGVCEVEYLYDPRSKEYKLIEINPRTWLWVALAKASGVDYAKIIYNYFHGKSIDYPQADRITNYWINPLTDLVFSTIGILKAQLNPLTYFLSLTKDNKVNAYFSRNDPKPGLAYFYYLVNFARQR
jgi:predicted ATP-grasp superfamily ATP-dependent carboligase